MGTFTHRFRNLVFLAIALGLNLALLFWNFPVSKKSPASLNGVTLNTEVILGTRRQPAPKKELTQASISKKSQIPKPHSQKPTAQAQSKAIAGETSGDSPAPAAPSSPGTSEKNIFEDELQNYIQRVIALLNRRKHYPRLSQERGEEGILKIKITLDASGRLLQYQWVQKSSFERLNQATTRTIQSTSFPPLPKNLPQKKLVLEIPIQYRIQNSRG